VIRCYFVGLCASSSTDQESNNISVYHLLEMLQYLAPSAPGAGLAAEAHAYLERDAEPEAPISLQFIWIGPDGATFVAGTFPEIPLPGRRMRVRLRVPFPPPWLGYSHLFAEWRHGEGPWTRSSTGWPVEFRDTAMTLAAPDPLPDMPPPVAATPTPST